MNSYQDRTQVKVLSQLLKSFLWFPLVVVGLEMINWRKAGPKTVLKSSFL